MTEALQEIELKHVTFNSKRAKMSLIKFFLGKKLDVDNHILSLSLRSFTIKGNFSRQIIELTVLGGKKAYHAMLEALLLDPETE